MKSKIHKAKFVCLFLAVLMIVQSCTVYKSTPISISQASQISKKVLVTTTTNSKLKFSRIEKTDSIYYGLKTVKGNETRIALKEADIASIRPYDKSKSKTATLVMIIIPIVVVIGVIIASMDFAPDFGGFGDGYKH
jgi:DNA polymerase III alpha subunit